jgi:hypothetical protein
MEKISLCIDHIGVKALTNCKVRIYRLKEPPYLFSTPINHLIPRFIPIAPYLLTQNIGEN